MPAAPKAASACRRSAGPSLRLRHKRDFDRVFNQPLRSARRHFTVLARSNQLNHARLGLAVSKKVDKRAVVRNRIKRMVRESFRLDPIAAAALDVVVIARPPAALEQPRAVRRELADHWQRLMKLAEQAD
ncbi:MAG: ribonuclease P protein component [Xanthomonadales bacterium]|nr:ribonuclease P protein component [Xanthomonadales bacterium]